jgi:hypothetical protein
MCGRPQIAGFPQTDREKNLSAAVISAEAPMRRKNARRLRVENSYMFKRAGNGLDMCTSPCVVTLPGESEKDAASSDDRGADAGRYPLAHCDSSPGAQPDDPDFLSHSYLANRQQQQGRKHCNFGSQSFSLFPPLSASVAGLSF